VSAQGVCGDCFQTEANNVQEVELQEEPPPSDIVEPAKRRSVPVRLKSFIPRTRSPVVFALVMACYSITLISLVGGLARAAHLRRPSPPFYVRGNPVDIISLLVAAPLIESLILIGIIELLRRVRAPEAAQIFTAALFSAAMHAPQWWPHAIIVLPSFCIQAASYLYWRRTSWKTAYWVLVLIHSLTNLPAALSAFTYATRHITLP
jgi:hypothetical protein